MKKIGLGIAVFLFLLGFYGVVLSQFQVNVIPDRIEFENPPGYYDYRGLINIHSLRSTGSSEYEEIILKAQKSNLDFIFFTDLNDFDPQTRFEGYHNKLMVFVDGEYSFLNSRILNIDSKRQDHLLGLGRTQPIFESLLIDPQRDEDYGLFVLAHPFKPGYQFRGEIPVGLDGLEVINSKSIWQKAWKHRRVSFLWTLFVYPFNRDLAFIRLFDFPKEEISLWDRINQQRRFSGFVGTDAEARFKLPWGGAIEFPSYEMLFRIFSHHILLTSELTGNFKEDRSKISSALKKGSFYLAFDLLANPKGFVAEIRQKKKRPIMMGTETPYQAGMTLHVTLPAKPLVPFETIIYQNGKRMMTSNSLKTEYVLPEPGTYRVVVRVIPTFPLPDGKKWIPWIFSNPFYLK